MCLHKDHAIVALTVKLRSQEDGGAAGAGGLARYALQQLLLDLARNALSQLPDLSDNDRFGLKRGGPLRISGGGRYWRVRMRVLTAIANCRTLLNFRALRSLEIGKHRPEEVLVLLRGLASNPVLRHLDVKGCKGFRRQAACEALGQLVASSASLRRLSLPGVGLKAAGLDALPEGFTRDRNSGLKKITISETEWKREGKGAIIDRALARNATQEAYLPLLLDGQVPVMPKAGRLFLCGAPSAGKTTLRTTMVRA